MADSAGWGFLVFVFLFYSYGEAVLLDDVAFISSPNYPTGYVAQPKVLSLYNFTVDPGYGFSFLFYRFALGPDDCLFFCTGGLSGCTNKKCSNEFDHRRPFYFYARQNVEILLSSQAPMRQYAGFYGQIKKANLQSQKYFTCNKQVDLVGSDAYFLVSDNYGVGMASSHEDCVVEFSANKTFGIKFAIYNFMSNSSSSIQLEGTPYRDGSKSYTIKKLYDPEAFYFTENAKFTFKSMGNDYQYFLYAIPFQVSDTRNDCEKTGTHDMSKESRVFFESKNGTPYGANQECSWQFNNLPPHSQLAFELSYFDSERCCDEMDVDGLQPGIFGEFNFEGHMEYFFSFATEKEISIHFASDAIENYVGFTGAVYTLDCDCGNPVINVASNHTAFVSSPGYSQQKTYCPGVNCEWKIKFQRTSLLIVKWNRPNLFGSDSVTLAYSDGTPMKTQAYVYDGSGEVIVSFLSNATSSWGFLKPSDVANGFSFQLQAVDLYIRYVDIDLCKEPLAQITSRVAYDMFDAVIYRISTRSCNNKVIELYTFLTTDLDQYFVMTLFDGDLETGKPVNYEYFTKTITPRTTFTSGTATVKIVRMTAYSTQELFGLATTIYGDGTKGGVHSTTTPVTWNIPSSSSDRVDVFFYYNFEYSLYNGIQISVDSTQPIKIFKGASLAGGNSVTGDNGALPDFVFGQLITVHTPKNTKSYDVSLSRGQESYWAIELTDGASGVIMSTDYADSVISSTGVNQQIGLFYSGPHRKHTIILHMQNALTDAEQMTIVTYDYNTELASRAYTAKDGVFSLVANATKVLVMYSTPHNTPSTGFIATYSLGGSYGTNGTWGRVFFEQSLLLFALISVLALI